MRKFMTTSVRVSLRQLEDGDDLMSFIHPGQPADIPDWMVTTILDTKSMVCHSPAALAAGGPNTVQDVVRKWGGDVILAEGHAYVPSSFLAENYPFMAEAMRKTIREVGDAYFLMKAKPPAVGVIDIIIAGRKPENLKKSPPPGFTEADRCPDCGGFHEEDKKPAKPQKTETVS